MVYQEFLGTEHILYSILQQKSARGTVLLRDLHVDIEELVDELESFFDRQGHDLHEIDTQSGRQSNVGEVAARSMSTVSI